MFLKLTVKASERLETNLGSSVFIQPFLLHIIRFPGPRRSGEARTSGDSGSDQAEVKVRRTVCCHRWRACKVWFFSRKIWIEEKFGKIWKKFGLKKSFFSGLPRSTRCLLSRRRGSGWLLRENLPKWKIKIVYLFCIYANKSIHNQNKIFLSWFSLETLASATTQSKVGVTKIPWCTIKPKVCYFMFLVWR